VFDVADEIVVLNTGRVVIDASATELRQSGVDLRQHLGIF
jgi:ABC-type branched-subunit amino acid transport system ATPase component